MYKRIHTTVKGSATGFLTFIREQGVVGLAIGFILGGAVSSLVKSLVQDIVNPLIGAFIGNVDTLGSVMLGPVALGSFLVAAIDFLILAAVIYWGFKALGLDKMDLKKSSLKIKK